MSKNEKIFSLIAVFLLVVSLLPIIRLGFYNHPTGDDYYYGVEAHRVWAETHSIPDVLAEAKKGVAAQYQVWQGTYSGMFLMYLAPNVFGDNLYHWVTCVILLCLVGSIFFLAKQLLAGMLHTPASTWLITASVLSMLCVQTVDFQPESFFWYNGSMYYTGFFSATLFFIGLQCKYILWQNKSSSNKALGVLSFPLAVFLCLFAFFLAGGNYVSFLFALLTTIGIAGWLFLIKRKKPAITISIVSLCMLVGFFISAAAPGNRVRQGDMWKIPAHQAIVKALIQGVSFCKGWFDPWWILALVIITPFLWKGFEKTSFRFRLPLVVIGFAYGIFCSMSCPTFYTMNSTGPARAVAIMYYGFAVFVFFSYGYLLGFLQRVFAGSQGLRSAKETSGRGAIVFGFLIVAACIGLQIYTHDFKDFTAVRAFRCLSGGEAAAYEEEYRGRLTILADPNVPDVVFAPYAHQADLLYVGDLSDDPGEPTNRRVAEYFGKSSVRVDWNH